MIMRVCKSAVVLEVKGVGLAGLLAGRAEVVVVGVGTPVTRAKAIVIRAEVLVTSAEAASVSPTHASVDTKIVLTMTKNAAKISVVAKTMSDITFRPILSSYDPSPWYEQDDVPSISPQEYGALLSAAWGTRVVFVPPPSPTHRDREKWLSSFWGCSEDSEESISEVGEHRGMEVVPEVGGEDFGAEDVGAEVVGAEHVGAGHRGIQVAVEEGLGEDLELIPVPSQALFFHLTPAEVQTLG